MRKNDKTMHEYENKIRRVLSFMPYAEIMYVSAETGQRLNKLFDMIDMVHRESDTAYRNRRSE